MKYLVEAHGGTVAAASDGEGTGAIFTVTLPLARRATKVTAASDEVTDLTGVTIFVVDDDANSRNMLKVALGRCGANVKTAESVASLST